MELTHASLLRLVEVELVQQYRRFLRKNLVISPRTCRFNLRTSTKDGGSIRLCNCGKTSLAYAAFLEARVGKPCTHIHYAKKCPLYQHFTGVDSSEIVNVITQDFILRLEDPLRRASSFKTLHTLWILLHEMEVPTLNWWCKIRLKLTARLYTKGYMKYLQKNTPKAEVFWDHLVSNFRIALETTKGE